jgi:hypothetical protein
MVTFDSDSQKEIRREAETVNLLLALHACVDAIEAEGKVGLSGLLRQSIRCITDLKQNSESAFLVLSTPTDLPYPKQAKSLGARCKVRFKHDRSTEYEAEFIRRDVEKPLITLIKLSDGRIYSDTDDIEFSIDE